MPVVAAAASRSMAPEIQSKGWEIWLVRTSTLSAGLRSSSTLVTLKTFVTRPGTFAWATIVAVAFAPFARGPTAQRSAPAEFEIAPWLLVAEMKLRFVGKDDCRKTLAANAGPRLVTARLKASCIPVRSGAVPRIREDPLRPRSAVAAIENGLLVPLCPAPSLARSETLAPDCNGVIVPVQTPLVKLRLVARVGVMSGYLICM